MQMFPAGAFGWLSSVRSREKQAEVAEHFYLPLYISQLSHWYIAPSSSGNIRDGIPLQPLNPPVRSAGIRVLNCCRPPIRFMGELPPAPNPALTSYRSYGHLFRTLLLRGGLHYYSTSLDNCPLSPQLHKSFNLAQVFWFPTRRFGSVWTDCAYRFRRLI